LTTEQLQAARAEKWRQKANPLLTSEDAEAWIESTGVSLFLPRKTQLQVPAPSFVEAVLGETNATPAPAAIQNAFDLAVRLFAAEKATPLNLLGAVSEQPDFLASPEALPYIFALRGDRDWKRGPREKSSPLVIESWKILKREGALTTSELQELLGREVTEAAVLRALSELWTALRILPIYAAGEPTTWELFESRHQKAMQIGAGMAQATAHSALISLYLDTAIAATSDEIETFLSPLSPRSRIREVVRGLAATRQLLTIALGAQSLLHIAGGLPEFPEVETPTEAQAETEAQPEASPQPRERRPFAPRSPRAPEQRRFDRPRKPFTPGERPAQRENRPRRDRPAFGDRPAARDTRRPSSSFSRPGASGPRKEWKPRREEGEFRPRREDKGGFDKPYRSRTNERGGERTGDQPTGEKPPRREWKPREEKKPFEKREWKPRREGEQEGRKEFRPRRAEGGFNKPYRSRTTPDRRSGDLRSGDQRSGDRRSGGQRPYRKFPPRDGDRPRPPHKEWKPRGEEGERREFRPRRTGDSPERREFKSRSTPGREFKPRREDGERKEFRPRKTEGGPQRREFKPRPSSGGGFKPRREGRSFGDREKPAGEKSFGAKRSFERREGFDRKKPPQRERRVEGGDAERPKKSFSKPGFKKSGKSFGGPKSGGGKRPSFGTKRTGRPSGKPSFGKRPNNRKGKKSSE
jgi:hypothetical protein